MFQSLRTKFASIGLLTMLLSIISGPLIALADDALIVDAGADQTVFNGTEVTVTANAANVFNNQLMWATFDWGDGTYQDTFNAIAPNVSSLSFTHLYTNVASDTPYTVTVCMSDATTSDGSDGRVTVCDTLTITVQPIPVFTVEAGVDMAITTGDTVTLTNEAYVINAAAAVLPTAQIDWRDGSEGNYEDLTQLAATTTDGDIIYLQGSHTYNTAGSYSVEICATDGVAPQTCDKLAITVSDPMPDLTVTSIALGPNNNIEFTLANIGQAAVNAASRVMTNYSVDGVEIGGFDSSTQSDNAYFAVGGSQVMYTNFPLLEGIHTVAVWTDNDNTVAESDENNNRREMTFTILPDLTVTSIALGPNNNVEFTLANIGTASVNAASRVITNYSVDGAEIGGFDSSAQSDNAYFAVGGSQVMYTNFPLLEGTHTVAVWTDNDNTVAESDENNNRREMTFTILPDLTVTSIALGPNNNVEFTLANIGTAAVNASSRVMTNYSVDGVEIGGFDSSAQSDNAYFAVGGSQVMYTNFPLLEGTHTVAVWTDNDNTVAESDENNNRREMTFTILPDLTVTSIALGINNQVEFTLANLSQVSVPASADVVTGVWVDGAGLGAYHSTLLLSNDYLNAGGIQTILTNHALTEGTHTVRVCTDMTLAVAESDETNDCRDMEFTITANGDPLRSDLAVTDIRLTSSASGENVIQFDLANLGLVSISASSDVVTTFLVDGVSANSYHSNILMLNDYLNAGGTQSITTSYNLSAGSHVVQVCIDTTDVVVNELRDDNNCLAKPFIVAGPVLPNPGPDTSSGSNGGTSGGGGGFVIHHHEDDQDVVLTEDDDIATCAAMTFIDVDKEDEGYDAIYSLWCQGVIHGRGDQGRYFSPQAIIKRDEATKVVSRLFGYVTMAHSDIPEVTETSYSDVSTDEPLAYYVETLTDEGFFEEEQDRDAFRPHEDMTFSEIIKLVEDSSGKEVDTTGYSQNGPMNRENFMELVYSLFE